MRLKYTLVLLALFLLTLPATAQVSGVAGVLNITTEPTESPVGTFTFEGTYTDLTGLSNGNDVAVGQYVHRACSVYEITTVSAQNVNDVSLVAVLVDGAGPLGIGRAGITAHTDSLDIPYLPPSGDSGTGLDPSDYACMVRFITNKLEAGYAPITAAASDPELLLVDNDPDNIDSLRLQTLPDDPVLAYNTLSGHVYRYDSTAGIGFRWDSLLTPADVIADTRIGQPYLGTTTADSIELVFPVYDVPGDSLTGDTLSLSIPRSSTSSLTSRIVLNAPGVSLSVEYIGDNAPALIGSAGNYTMSVPAGTSWQCARLEATVGSSATNQNACSFTVVNADGFNDYSQAEITDLDTDEVIVGAFYGISRIQASSTAGSVTNTFTEISGLGGFSILFNR